MASLEEIYEAVLGGKARPTKQLVQEALEAGLSAPQILNGGLLPAIAEAGRRFERKDYYIPDLVLAGRAMSFGMEVLAPHLRQGDVERKGKAVIGTVEGDLHDIGKSLVSIMSEGVGFEMKDIGVDVTAETFVMAVRDEKPDILMLSALLTTTMPAMRQVIEALEEAGLRGKVKVMVGGAPVTESYAHRIEADGYAPNAAEAARLAVRLVKG